MPRGKSRAQELEDEIAMYEATDEVTMFDKVIPAKPRVAPRLEAPHLSLSL